MKTSKRHTKGFCLAVCAYLLFSFQILAQAPDMMSYQAVIRDAENGLVANTQVSVKISIMKGSPSGTTVFAESHQKITNDNGLLSLEIGTGSNISGHISQIDWSDGPYYIRSETDPAGGGNYSISITSQLMSVPYALYAKESGTPGPQGPPGPEGPQGPEGSFPDGNLVGEILYWDGAQWTAIPPGAHGQTLSMCNGIPVWGPCNGNGNNTVTDYDGNIYHIISIGSQEWLLENLKTTKYNDGTAIPNVPDNTVWSTITTPAYAWYDNDEGSHKDPYGALYNWYAVDPGSNGGKNICPVGWRVPTDDDWTDLTDHLGGLSVAGGKMKEAGTTHWNPPNTGATNESGFTGLPGGYRFYLNGVFDEMGNRGGWWSATEGSATMARKRNLIHTEATAITGSSNKKQGYSVRCIKD